MAEKKILAVIPARLASVRLPGKPLRQIAGKTMVQRVWEQVLQCKSVTHRVVATDSEEIAAEVLRFGGEVLMTAPELPSGSDRAAAAAEILAKRYCTQSTKAEDFWTAIVNVQGDMPFIQPELIDRVVQLLLSGKFLDSGLSEGVAAMATVAVPITEREVFESNSVVKVVVGGGNRALYFSRAPIPHLRDGVHPGFPVPSLKNSHECVFGFKHLGLYCFTPAALRLFSSSSPSTLEQIEKLEQLRLLEMNVPIGVEIVSQELVEPGVEVDTPADLARAEEIARSLG